jgi:acyl dehydratase
MTTTAGHFFEDFRIGAVFESAGHTVTAAEIKAFADLTKDHNPLHVDAQYAATMPYGQIIAHGMLGMSLGAGLIEQTGVHSGTSIALLGIRDWAFRLPVIAGDTIRARMTVTDKRLSQQDAARGILVRRIEILNQDGLTVQEGEMTLLVRARER